MGDAPLISIVLPVWNGQRYLSQAIESILSQTYENFELIIVNDYSEDASLLIAQSFSQNDPRIKVLSNDSNIKLPASLNKGFSVARGDYFTWTSDDNILEKDFLKIMLDELLKSDADIVYSDFNSIDDEGRYINISEVGEPEELVSQNTIGASFLYKQAVHTNLGGYDISKFLYEDYDFWVRSYLAGFRFKRIGCVLYSYRRHDAALTSTRLMPPDYSLYRFELRKRFGNVSQKAAYAAREILLGYWKELGMLKTFQLLFEAFCIDHYSLIKYIAPKIKKIPTKIYSQVFGNRHK
jgi:glycosyltransferase involved in cell wall biosynthesis